MPLPCRTQYFHVNGMEQKPRTYERPNHFKIAFHEISKHGTKDAIKSVMCVLGRTRRGKYFCFCIHVGCLCCRMRAKFYVICTSGGGGGQDIIGYGNLLERQRRGGETRKLTAYA